MKAKFEIGPWEFNEDGQPYCYFTVTGCDEPFKQMVSIGAKMKLTYFEKIKSYCRNKIIVYSDDIMQEMGLVMWTEISVTKLNNAMVALGYRRKSMGRRRWRYILPAMVSDLTSMDTKTISEQKIKEYIVGKDELYLDEIFQLLGLDDSKLDRRDFLVSVNRIMEAFGFMVTRVRIRGKYKYRRFPLAD